jgi:hypothetical protein
LLTDAIGIGVGLVHLVDGHHDRRIGSLGVTDGLDRLGHHRVIGSHHQHHDVRDLCTAGTHGRKGLVTRRIKE